MSQEEKPRTLTEFLSDPQTAREATDLLDRLRNLAVKMGGGAPIADSLAGSLRYWATPRRAHSSTRFGVGSWPI